jgi:hypothetical protein
VAVTTAIVVAAFDAREPDAIDWVGVCAGSFGFGHHNTRDDL